MMLFKIFTLFLLFISSYDLLANEVWTITALDWQPYAGRELKHQGSSVHKLRTLLATKNIDLNVRFLPWKRAKIIAKRKSIVGYFPAWPEEVDSGFIASHAIDQSEIGLIQLNSSNVEFDSLEDLFKNNKIGIVNTYVYPKKIAKLIEKYPNSVIKSAMNESALLKMLVLKRFKIAITDPAVMKFYAKKFNISDLKVIKVLMRKELVLSLRDDPENQKRIKLLNSILSKTQ